MEMILNFLHKIIEEPENTVTWGVLADYLEERGFPTFFLRDLCFSKWVDRDSLEKDGKLVVTNVTNFRLRNKELDYYSFKVENPNRFVFFYANKDTVRTELNKHLCRFFLELLLKHMKESL